MSLFYGTYFMGHTLWDKLISSCKYLTDLIVSEDQFLAQNRQKIAC